MSGLLLEPIEPEPHEVDDRHDITLGAWARRSRWRPVLVAGVAVALVATVALVGRNGGGAAAPPTTVAPTTVPPTSTSTPRQRRPGPSYTEDRTFLNFLGARSGTSLYGVSADGSVVRIDLDAGVVTQRQLRRTDRGQLPASIFARAGGAVVVAQDQAVAVADGRNGVIMFLAAKDTAVYQALAPDEVWLVHMAGTAGRIAERRTVHDGAVNGTIPDLMAGDVLGDDGTGALLVQTGSGVYRVDETGDRPQRITTDAVVAWSASTLIVQQCDDRFACSWDQVDRATGDRRSLGAASWGGSVLSPQLSPDGTHLAYVGGIGGPTLPAVEVMDLATGERLALDHQAALTGLRGGWTGLVWSADGQWLFWLAETGSLRAWHVGDQDAITVGGAGHIPDLQTIGLAR
jgi:hypothetical protein